MGASTNVQNVIFLRSFLGVILGRLGMIFVEASEAYKTLVSEALSEPKRSIFGQHTFKATKLEQTLKNIVWEATGDPEERLKGTRPQSNTCKV
jgi:hypothetical protein